MSSRARLGARRKTRSGAPSDLAGGEHRRFNAHDADVQNALAGDFRNVYAAEFVAMLSAVRVLVYEGDFDFEVRSPPISRRSQLEASALRRRG